MNLPDYSEYLKRPGILTWIEKEWKDKPAMHDAHARVINDAIEKYKIETVIEIGCGTGEVAKRLNACSYSGYDDNESCISIASGKCEKQPTAEDKSYKLFFLANIRDLEISDRADLVFTFGFLKHFGLHEWSDIFCKVSSFGKYFIFDMPVAEETKDDGVDYHHVWKSMKEIKKEIVFSGMKLIEVINPDSVEPIFITGRK